VSERVTHIMAAVARSRESHRLDFVISPEGREELLNLFRNPPMATPATDVLDGLTVQQSATYAALLTFIERKGQEAITEVMESLVILCNNVHTSNTPIDDEGLVMRHHVERLRDAARAGLSRG
jgi:hypothetical protein